MSKWHASELRQCHRKTITNRMTPRTHEAKTIMRFALGFALQEWFLGREAESKEAFGIFLSADKIVGGNIIEFKTTRKGYEIYQKDEKGKYLKDLPKKRFDPEAQGEWILRTRDYCAAEGINTAHILVFFIHADDLKGWTLEFTDAELDEARADIDRLCDSLNFYWSISSNRTLTDSLPPCTCEDWMDDRCIVPGLEVATE